MRNLFVTRHNGAIQWAKEDINIDSQIVSHFDIGMVDAGDKVYGVLPIHLAAEVGAKGAEYFHLVMDIPPESRGKELTAQDMRDYGAKIVPYKILKL